MTDALSRQIGGSHYKNGGIQPVELGYANRYDDCIFSSIKYFSRFRVKAGMVDIEKGRHFIDLRVDMIKKHGLLSGVEVIPIADYLTSNKITGIEAGVISELHYWSVRLPHNFPTHEHIASRLGVSIDRLVTQFKGENNV